MKAFSIAEIEDSKEFSVLASGLYHVCITNVEYKSTKNNKGEMFVIDFSVINPQEHASQGVKSWIIYEHESIDAQRIGHAALADLLFTIQVSEFSSLSDLKQKVIAKELVIDVINEETDDGVFARVQGYYSRGGKHRNQSRALQNVQLGPNGKVIKKSKPKTKFDDDVAF